MPPINLKRETPKDENGARGLLPKGVYRVVIEDVTSKVGPSGFAYLNMRLRPIVNGKKAGQAIWDKVSLSPDARFRVDAFLDAIGADEEGEADEKSFVGKSYWASVTSREYQGQWSNEVKQYLTPEAAESLLEKQAQAEGSSDAFTIPTERKTRAVAEPAAAGAGGRARKGVPVIDTADSASPF